MATNSRYTQSKDDGYVQVSLGNIQVGALHSALKLGLIFSDTQPTSDDQPQFVFSGFEKHDVFFGNVTCYAKVLNDEPRTFTALDIS